MPVFEYKCKECGTVYDVLHKSSSSKEDVVCPKCSSKKNVKLVSSFSSSFKSDNSSGGCSDGSCGLPSYGGCANGMCGLN